jgi:hypothetical protein
MTTSAKSANGVTLTRDGNAIAEITKLGVGAITLETNDVSNHDSANDFREFIGGMLDGGEISIEGNFISSDTDGQIGLLTDQLAKTVQDFIITWPTAVTATYTFKALVTKFKPPDFNYDGTQTFSATLKITGKPTLAITASTNITTIACECTSGVLTLSPDWSASTYEYALGVATGDAWVKLTVTDATATSLVAWTTIDGTDSAETALTSGVQSGALTLDDADTYTKITVKATDTGKVPVEYVIHVYRPAA